MTNCTVNGCAGKARRRGLCSSHHHRWLRYGDPEGGGPARNPGALCSIPDCGGKVHGRGWCSKHYLRWKKHGDPTLTVYAPPRSPEDRDLAGKVFGEWTVLSRIGTREAFYGPNTRRASWVAWMCRCSCGTEREIRAANLLHDKAHYCRGRLHIKTYRGAHSRVRLDLGAPSRHLCVDGCGRQAQDWSYTGDDPNEITDDQRRTYSLDPSFYVPRCKSCHSKFDDTGRNFSSSTP